MKWDIPKYARAKDEWAVDNEIEDMDTQDVINNIAK